MNRKRSMSVAAIVTSLLVLPPSNASGDAHHPLPKQKWSFDGITGTYDRASLQRGYQVYKEVCAACHGLKRIAYRNLTALGFSADEVKAIAAGHEVPDIDDEGQPKNRKALPSDYHPSPYPNEKAARAANNAALPPDQSLIIKARKGGADYVYALLTGYCQAPEGCVISTGMYYNPYFPGGQISMAPPLTDGQVTFSDGTKATVSQMAHDVVTFLAWASEPEAERRKQLGFQVLFFLIIMTSVFYASMRLIWKDVKGKKE